jgi:hypothetical protein
MNTNNPIALPEIARALIEAEGRNANLRWLLSEALDRLITNNPRCAKVGDWTDEVRTQLSQCVYVTSLPPQSAEIPTPRTEAHFGSLQGNISTTDHSAKHFASTLERELVVSQEWFTESQRLLAEALRERDESRDKHSNNLWSAWMIERAEVIVARDTALDKLEAMKRERDSARAAWTLPRRQIEQENDRLKVELVRVTEERDELLKNKAG